MATIEDFAKIEMKIGTILSAEFIEGADKLLKLSVDFGPLPIPIQKIQEALPEIEINPQGDEASLQVIPQPTRDIRQILSGIREYYQPLQLIGKQCPFITNLEPRTMRGLTSYGMILAVGLESGGAMLLHPENEVSPGSKLR